MSTKALHYEELCIQCYQKKLTPQAAVRYATISKKPLQRIIKKYASGGARALCHAST